RAAHPPGRAWARRKSKAIGAKLALKPGTCPSFWIVHRSTWLGAVQPAAYWVTLVDVPGLPSMSTGGCDVAGGVAHRSNVAQSATVVVAPGYAVAGCTPPSTGPR